MIEQHEHQPDVHAARDVECGIKVGEEVRVRAGGQSAVVVFDARPAVREDEPAHGREAQPRHLREVASDRLSPPRHAHMRAPDVGAEVHPVVHGGAVGRPRVVAAVPEHHLTRSRHAANPVRSSSISARSAPAPAFVIEQGSERWT
jgi:hypothetical protein